mmetsp:Transcript_132288/g.263940  ORF Transcript_132288/g.263940 Transcript_132288/m.263940 type:complete len:248 (+) Transcript_132288:36-779(+)
MANSLQSPSPSNFLKTLPASLPEPYYYLSAAQKRICAKSPQLAPYAQHLPGWVPHRLVADAWGHNHTGIEAALRKLGGQPYVWCTEFENVHTHWKCREPSIIVNGVKFACSEDCFHKLKPYPFDKLSWDGPGPGLGKRDEVMRTAVRMKFTDPAFRELLIASHPHPLLSIKGDAYWGVKPSGEGENMLARLLMDLRAELVAPDEIGDKDRCDSFAAAEQGQDHQPENSSLPAAEPEDGVVEAVAEPC